MVRNFFTEIERAFHGQAGFCRTWTVRQEISLARFLEDHGTKAGFCPLNLMMNAQATPKPWQCTEMELRKLPLEVSLLRRVECVNAFQGVRKLVAALQAAKEGLRALIEKTEEAGWPRPDTEKARRALAMLEGLE
jgi:hypothetical protein